MSDGVAERSPWGAVRCLATMVDRSTAWWAVSTTFALVITLANVTFPIMVLMGVLR